MARCLNDLNRAQEAWKVIEDFQAKFPNYSQNAKFKELKKDVKKACNRKFKYIIINNFSNYFTLYTLKILK